MELFDLYDRDRRPLGRTMVRGTPQPEGTCRIVVHICIFSPRGELLVQQRQPFKKGWSNYWDVSVGGSVISGEDSLEGAVRETGEELGYRLDPAVLRPSLTVDYADGFDDIYIVRGGVDLNSLTLQASEVQRVKWADEAEVKRMIADGTFIPYSPEYISLIFYFGSHETIYTGSDRSRPGKRF